MLSPQIIGFFWEKVWGLTGFGPGCPRFARFSTALATVRPRSPWPLLAKQRFLGPRVVFEKQWTSLALPATGLQFLAGNGPFLALSQTRPAAAPNLQNPNGPPWAGKAPNMQTTNPFVAPRKTQTTGDLIG